VTVDEITLCLPGDQEFHQVAHLVLGGLAIRLNLTFEHLEDLQVALDELLGRRRDGAELIVSLRVHEDEIEAVVGPYSEDLRAELARDAGDDVSIGRVLETVVDRVRVTDRDGGQWIELAKTIEPLGVSPSR
jgi:hypothetical protein